MTVGVSPPKVAGGARIRAGAVRADLEQVEVVDRVVALTDDLLTPCEAIDIVGHGHGEHHRDLTRIWRMMIWAGR